MNRKIWRSREGDGVSVHMYTHIHFIAFVPGIVWLCVCIHVYSMVMVFLESLKIEFCVVLLTVWIVNCGLWP